METTSEKKDLLEELKSRFTQLETNRQRFIGRWQEAQQYVAASVYDWNNLDAIPEAPKRFSSSPCNYLKILTSGLIGYSLSPHIIWFKLSMENKKLLNLYGVKDWLEQCEEILYSYFNKSNLYQNSTGFIEDSACIGHGVLMINDNLKNGSLRYSRMRPNELYLDSNEDGEVDTIYRKFLITLRNAVELFGLENLSETRQDDYKDVKKWNNQFEVLHAVYPRRDRDTGLPDSKNMPFASIYVDIGQDYIIMESGYEDFPYAVFLWNPIAGFAYGESPVMGAMTDIKALNVMEESRLKIAQMSAEPPLQASDSLRNISLVPRGITYKKKDETIDVIRTGENYPITIDVVNQKKQEVKDWFNVDFFLMLQSQEGRQMTATEVMELQGEKAAVLSNLIVNLNVALSKIITRSFNILLKAGIMPPVPEALAENGGDLSIDFMGPLAQAQKKYHSMGGISSALQLVAPIIQLYPNSGDYIDGDELMKRALEGQGVPEAVIREDDDVKEIREQRAQAQAEAQAQAQQQQMLQNVMGNASQLNEPIRQGSVLSDLNEQLAGGLNGGQ